MSPFQDVHLLRRVLLDFVSYFVHQIWHVFNVLAVNIDTPAVDNPPLRHIIHRIAGQNRLSRPLRPGYSDKALGGVGKESGNQFVFEFCLNESTVNFGGSVPEERLLFLEIRLPALEVPIDVASVLLLLRGKQREMLCFFLSMVDLY